MADAHSLLVNCYHVVTRQQDYQDLGPNYFDERNKEADKRPAVKRLENLGFQVERKPALTAIA